MRIVPCHFFFFKYHFYFVKHSNENAAPVSLMRRTSTLSHSGGKKVFKLILIL